MTAGLRAALLPARLSGSIPWRARIFTSGISWTLLAAILCGVTQYSVIRAPHRLRLCVAR